MAGDAVLCSRIEAVVEETVRRQREPEEVRAAVVDMRRRILREKPPASIWDVKTGAGGLIDVEFIAQGLTLMHAHTHPELLHRNTHETLRALLDAGLLEATDGDVLLRAVGLYHRVLHAQRLCTRPGEKIRAEALPAGVAHILARAAEAPDLERARAVIEDARAQVAVVFRRLMEAG